MGLRAVVKSLDEIDEGLRSLYTQVGDEFVLDIDDKDFKSRLGEFRDNNIELTNKLKSAMEQAGSAEELQKKLQQFEGLDPEAARKAVEQMTSLEEQKLIDAGQLEDVLSQRTERMRADYEGKISALQKSLDSTTGDRDKLHGQLSSVVIDNSLQQAVAGVASIRKGAMQDVLARGRQVWKLDDQGNPVPYGSDGNTMYGKDPQKVLSMDEWAQGLMAEAPYLFEPNSGGGGPGNKGGGGQEPGTVNAGDSEGLSANLEGLAAGTVVVSQ